MVDELMRPERVKVDIVYLGRPLEIVQLRVLVLVLDPPSFQEGVLQITIFTLDDEHFTVLNAHGLLPGL
jgi:hypothetical protein